MDEFIFQDYAVATSY
jgi:hypothetical protein